MNFADRLIEAIIKKKNPSVVGLDTDFEKIPEFLKKEYTKKYGNNFEAAAKCILEFNKRIIDATKDIVPGVKVQSAFYEQYGHEGIWAFEETVKYARKAGLIIIEDAKRNDIGNTAKAYSIAHLGKTKIMDEKISAFDVDGLTVNGYLGSDGVLPFVEEVKEYDKGIFVLVKTSNKSSGELQDLETKNGKRIYEIMADSVNIWGKNVIGKTGYSSVGAAVGATYPKEAEILRKIMTKAIFLVPGYGAQGGQAKDLIHFFNKDGCGAVVNNSRGIIFAYQKSGNDKEFEKEARKAAIDMKEDITKALKDAGICAW
jgi:orotidine-5'-phosphate decarboxylase